MESDIVFIHECVGCLDHRDGKISRAGDIQIIHNIFGENEFIREL